VGVALDADGRRAGPPGSHRADRRGPDLVLSIARYPLGVANAIDPDQNLRAGLSLTTSLVLAVVVTAGGLYLATRRLGAFALAGDPA
jgi:hypothetical protein